MTVGLVIVSHSARLAEGVVELAGQMTQGKTPLAAAGGAGANTLGTSADRILAAIESVDGPDGVLVLLDLGSAILSAEMTLEMLTDEQRARTVLSYAPLVEGAVAAALEASLDHPLAAVQRAAEGTARVEQLRKLKPISQEEQTEPAPPEQLSPPATAEREAQLTLTNSAGLHARPAGLFVQTAGRFQAQVQVLARGRQADAISIMGVLSLGARQGDTITLRASGEQADAAIAALSELVRANFYEATRRPSSPAPAKEPSPAPSTEHGTWRGVTTSKGVAIGPALLYVSGSLVLTTIQQRTISEQQVADEQALLREALNTTEQELAALSRQVQQDVGQAESAIFDAQALMVRDPALQNAALQLIQEQHLDAASALARVGEQQATLLEQLDNELLAARATDVRDVVSRMIRSLRGQQVQDLSALRQPVILLAHDLTPSDTVQLRPELVLGICTTRGGPTAHAAILARALGIPALAGLGEDALAAIHDGDELGLDADQGVLYYLPPPEVRAELGQRLAEQQQQLAANKRAASEARAPVIINDRRIHLLANVANEAEAEAARQWGAEGIGLLRTEFLFASAATLPDEEEQRQRYVRVFRAFKGNAAQSGPIVVRTLDAGADKPLPALASVLGAGEEANPALGLRGIRIHLAHQELLTQQLAALLRAAAETDVQLHIMFPMLATVEELRAAKAIFERVYADLRQRGIAVPAHVPLGIMVEVPSAVVMAEELAQEADFFSIGANDLLQYTVASDRTNPAVSYLYNPMQPAVLRLIQQVAEAGRRAGKPVAVCGEIASDARIAPVLVGLGVDELSMTPTAIPSVRTALTSASAQRLLRVADDLRGLKTVAEVEQAFKDLAPS
ncbi:MAG: phosphoenolpyruvate--protein phosphotransferase [Chloroflexota bacterium]|nr:phosphoenolpyruvate--protein phosphotransferase [Chloroflexota bacterium]